MIPESHTECKLKHPLAQETWLEEWCPYFLSLPSNRNLAINQMGQLTCLRADLFIHEIPWFPPLSLPARCNGWWESPMKWTKNRNGISTSLPPFPSIMSLVKFWIAVITLTSSFCHPCSPNSQWSCGWSFFAACRRSVCAVIIRIFTHHWYSA